MREIYFGLGMIFLVLAGFSFVSAGGSSSGEVNFGFPGCPYGSEDKAGVGECFDEGQKFCAQDNLALSTFNDAGACLGVDGVEGGDDCCPSGYFCREATASEEDAGYVEGEYYCMPLVDESCEDFEFGECGDKNCCWVFTDDAKSEGVCKSKDSCGIYEIETQCAGDNCGCSEDEDCDVGEIKIVGGKDYVVEGCGCKWGENPDECIFGFDLAASFTDPSNPSNKDRYSCSKRYDCGECENGVMVCEVSATLRDKGDNVIVNEDTREEADCVNSTEEKVCGQPLVRLPGFSFVNVVLVLAGLVGFYFFKKR